MRNHPDWTRPAFVLILVFGVLVPAWSQVITDPGKEGGTGRQVKTAILTPSEGQVVQQTYSLMIRWTGILNDKFVEGQLLQGTTLVKDLGDIENNGSYELDISRKFPAGEYRIKLTTSQGEIYSKPFKIEAAPARKKMAHPVLTVFGGIFLALSLGLTILMSGNDGGIM